VSAVVSDSSPLNYLALLSDFDLLRQIYHTVVIPPAVYREVVESGADYPVAKAVEAALGDWASVAEAPGPAHVATLRSAFHLDLGESEAILVAEALGDAPVLMDERRGVR
jgi:predicted nucleic acid-binding protein